MPVTPDPNFEKEAHTRFEQRGVCHNSTMQLNEAQREAYLLSYDQDEPEECAWIHISLFKDVVLPLLPQVEADVAERLFREDRLAKRSLVRAFRENLFRVARYIVASVPVVREWNRTQRPMWELRRILDSLPDAP